MTGREQVIINFSGDQPPVFYIAQSIQQAIEGSGYVDKPTRLQLFLEEIFPISENPLGIYTYTLLDATLSELRRFTTTQELAEERHDFPMIAYPHPSNPRVLLRTHLESIERLQIRNLPTNIERILVGALLPSEQLASLYYYGYIASVSDED